MFFSYDATPSPPILRNQEKWFRYVPYFTLFFGPGLIDLLEQLSPDFFAHTGFTVLFGQSGVWGVPLLMFVLLALGYRYFGLRRRLMSKAEKHDYLLCGTCGYVHTHASESGKCPECESRFRHGLLKSYWSRFTRQQSLYRVIPWVKRRRAWSYGVVSAFSIFLFVITILVTSPIVKPWHFLNFIILLSWPMALAWGIAYHFQNRRLNRLATRVIKSEYRLCPDCNQVVNAQEKDAVHHPRCRSSIPDQDLGKFWREYCPPHWELEMAGLESTPLSG